MRCLFAYRRYRLAFRQPLRTAHGLWVEREGILLRLTAENGWVGWGEAAPVPGFRMESVETIAETCQAWGNTVDLDEPPEIPPTLPTLRNAWWSATFHLCPGFGGQAGRAGPHLDLAEAAGRVEQRVGDNALHPADPLNLNEALNVAALLPGGPACLGVAATRVESGFRAFKWKVGAGEWRDELAILDDLCAVLPSGSKLRLDANGAWDRRTAERWLERCADRPIEFIEQPVDRDARGAEDLLLGLAGDFPTPLALDESLIGAGDLEQWLGRGWSGYYVVKPSLLPDPAAALTQLARVGAKVVFSSALETAVGARAALECAFGWTGGRRALGFGVWPLFAHAECDGPAAAPFLRRSDLERLNPEAVWNAVN
jgi:O-succinylbenzoate synthase